MFSIGCLLVNSLLEIAIFAISLILCEIFINMSKYRSFCRANSLLRKACRINFFALSIVLVVGFAFSCYFDNTRKLEVSRYDNCSGILIGTIMDSGEYTGSYWQYTLEKNKINEEKIKSNILVRSKDKLNFGDKIKTTAKFKLPTQIRNIGGFDYSKYNF